MQNILLNFDEEYIVIQEAMSGKFWPAVFASTITLQEQHLFSLPARMGGMGIRNPVDTAKVNFTISRTNIVDGIKGSKFFHN